MAQVKLVWFVPMEALDATRSAVFDAGAGRIGDYERCSWYTAGTGTFLGGEGTEPAVGESGAEEHVPELRVETVVPDEASRTSCRAPARIRTRSRPTTSTRSSTREAKLFTDGGSRGNPARPRTRSCSRQRTAVLEARGEAIGVATNNVAEYSALVASSAPSRRVTELEVVSDSELVVKQMRGEYRVKNRALQNLFLEASRLARSIHRVTYTAVRREHNEARGQPRGEALDGRVRGYDGDRPTPRPDRVLRP